MKPADYKAYLELLEKYKEKYGFKLFSFALMPNQLELLMELREGTNISVIMHDLNSSYTKYFNSAYNRKGHLFRERFKSTVIEKEPYLLGLINYIHSKARMPEAVKERPPYIFTSDILYLNQNVSQTEAAEEIKKTINIKNEIAEAFNLLKKYFPRKASFVDYAAGISSQELEELSRKLERSSLLGSGEFIESVSREILQRKSRAESQRQVFRPQIILYLSLILASSAITVFVLARKLNRQKAILPAEKIDSDNLTKKEPAALTPARGLEGSEWTIKVKPKEKTEASYPGLDKIVFRDEKVYSGHLLAGGYLSSNYSLRVQDDGTLVWETMQFNPKTQERAFLRGEINSGVMRGTIVLRAKGSQDATFDYNTLSVR